MPQLPAGRRPRRAVQQQRRRRRMQRPRREEGYVCADITAFSFERLTSPENLHKAYRKVVEDGGHAAGVDGVHPGDFSGPALWQVLRIYSEKLQLLAPSEREDEGQEEQAGPQAADGCPYAPQPTRPCRIPKRSRGFRELSIPTAMDRAVATALDTSLKPFWRREIDAATSAWPMLATLVRAIERRGHFYLVTDDIRNCFPNAPLDEAMRLHRRHIGEEQSGLLSLISRFVYWPDASGRSTGLRQGSPYSPVTMELVLHHLLDRALDAALRNTPRFRYVDNQMCLCEDAREGERVLSVVQDAVESIGFQLKNEDGPPCDIRDPERSRVVLGFIPRASNGRITFEVAPSAYDSLAEGLWFADKSPNPEENAFRRCSGWLRSQGPGLTRTAEAEVVSQVVALARAYGFRNISHREMRRIALSARKQWRKTLRNAR